MKTEETFVLLMCISIIVIAIYAIFKYLFELFKYRAGDSRFRTPHPPHKKLSKTKKKRTII